MISMTITVEREVLETAIEVLEAAHAADWLASRAAESTAEFRDLAARAERIKGYVLAVHKAVLEATGSERTVVIDGLDGT